MFCYFFVIDVKAQCLFFLSLFYDYYLLEGGIFLLHNHIRHFFYKDYYHDLKYLNGRLPTSLQLPIMHPFTFTSRHSASQVRLRHNRESGSKAWDRATRSRLHQVHKLRLTRVGTLGIH